MFFVTASLSQSEIYSRMILLMGMQKVGTKDLRIKEMN
jgi:hypothetical protein